MRKTNQEKGQALILITFAAVALIGFSALAVDGARGFEDKRHAQNAADTSALAAALAYSRSQNMQTAALTRATENGYNNNGTTNTVTVTITDTAATICPANLAGKEIKVTIKSTINTTFGKVLGRNTMASTSVAVARACGTYSGPPFDGNAIVSLSKTGKAYDGTGNPNWNITGGGIYSNSSASNSAYCNGSAVISAPSVTVVGGTQFDCAGTNFPGGVTTGATQYSATNASAFFPAPPTCNGTAQLSGGTYYPDSTPGTVASNVAWTGNMNFAPGIYCVTNSPGTFNGQITGSEVMFYLTHPTFSMKFNGGGFISATAPSSGEWKGILIYAKPQYDSNGNLINTQSFDLRGNGGGSIRGSVIAPSASVTLFGNSDGGAIQSQVIAYNVDSGGTADINISYDPNQNFQTTQPYTLSLLE